MGRHITPKIVQIHFECICGYNSVDHDKVLVKWANLARAGIKRKQDRTTGKPFLFQYQYSAVCHGHEEI